MINVTTELSRTYVGDRIVDQLSSVVGYHPRKSEAHLKHILPKADILARMERHTYLPHLQLPSHTNRTLPGIVIEMYYSIKVK